jgi:hypothetical protein
MKALTLDELKRMVDTQNAGMMDLCEILEYQEGLPSDLGKPVKSWIPRADPVACGYNGQARREVMEGGQVTVTDAVMRLPMGTTLERRDRVRLTHRFGAKLDTTLEYEILGEARQGASGLVLNLRSVTNAAAG